VDQTNEKGEVIKMYAMFKRDIFYDTKMFGGKAFNRSLNMPAGLIHCTKEKADSVAAYVRMKGMMARIVKKRYVDYDENSRVAYMVYERK
jgi:hypothetical protein